MMVFKYDISDIAAQDMECFRDMTAYVSSYIISIDKTENGEMYFNITDGHADEVRRKLDILKNSLSESKYDCSVEEKVFFSTADHQTLNNASIYEELLGREDIIKITDGVYAYGGLFLKVYNYFSEYFSKAAREMFGSELLEYKVPVLYPAKEYERGKYFENFPHHIMFQTLIKNDIEVLERFAEKSMDNGKLLEEMQVPKNVLRHAACVPVYKWNENTVRKYESSKKYLISGKCFRNEDKNVCELLRLNEFYMKEIVFIGKPAQVAENLEYSRQHLWFELIDKFIKLRISHQTSFFHLFMIRKDFNGSVHSRRYYNGMHRCRSAITFERIHTNHLSIYKLNDYRHRFRSKYRRTVITMEFPFFHITVKTPEIRFS